MMDTVLIQAAIGIGVPTAIALVGYGMLKARSNGYKEQIDILRHVKADKDVVAAEFRAVNEKLDMILEMVKK